MQKPFYACRILLFMAFLLVFHTSSSAQSMKRAWVRHFGKSDMSEARSILALPDGSALVAGYTMVPKSSRADAWLIKVDENGKKIWEKTYGGKGWDEFIQIKSAKNGDCLLAGWTDSQGAGKTDAWLMRININGEVLWQKTFGSKRWEEAQALLETSDEQIILATTFNPKKENDNIRVFKLNPNGEEVWHYDFSKGIGREVVHNMIELPNKNIILVGYTSQKPGEGRENGILVSLKPTGELAWEKQFGLPGMDALHDVSVTTEGELIAVGFCNQPKKSGQLRLLKISQKGEILLEKVMGGQNFDKGRTLCLLENGNIAVSGFTASEGMGKADTWTLIFDQNFDLKQKDVFGGEGKDLIRGMDRMPNGDIIVAGKIEFISFSTFLVIRYTSE